jgi:hypothetical protein
MKNYTRQELEAMIEFATGQLNQLKEQPEIVLNSKGAVTFRNLKVTKVNGKSLILSDIDGNDYLFQGKPHKNGYTNGPRINVRVA